jgi:hypothetical protein
MSMQCRQKTLESLLLQHSFYIASLLMGLNWLISRVRKYLTQCGTKYCFIILRNTLIQRNTQKRFSIISCDSCDSCEISKNVYFNISVLFFCSAPTYADEIKKSKSGICHDQYSSYFKKTKNFTAFNNLASCLESGGRLSKNYKGRSSNTANIPEKLFITASPNTSPNYSRSQFGSGWVDTDKDYQNSRMETLISQSVGQLQYKTAKQCKVKSGRWISPFTGLTIYNASEIDIDHVVPLH